jgi:hypothetical protein
VAKKKATKKAKGTVKGPPKTGSLKVDLWKNPTGFGGELAGKADGCFRAAGLDLGTNCGIAWADFKQGQPIETVQVFGGQWSLDLGPYDSGPLRFIRLKQFLAVLQPDIIGFEDVKFTPSGELKGRPLGVVVARVATASELLGAFKVILTTWAEEHGIAAEGIGIGVIKKYATGKGNANKVDMITAANEQFQIGLDPDTYEQTGADNIADAMFVCDMILQKYHLGIA